LADCDRQVVATNATRRPSIDYALTDLGSEMVESVRALGPWVIENLDRIDSAGNFDRLNDDLMASPTIGDAMTIATALHQS